MKKILIVFSSMVLGLLVACGGGAEKASNPETNATTIDTSHYDVQRGHGKWTFENLKVGTAIDEKMAAEGEKIAAEKCGSCHQLTQDTKVGPGWQGVTARRSPEWIMNFITNPDGMIDKDPQLKALWEKCYVRMPDLNITDVQARQVLEFLRKNDTKAKESKM